ncbi:LOW QUALITY PROTEIN: hypothetical protein Cgig2_007646 [Carnegiea gigantea]|uniref:Uncharacterized protein n=1 Tax=Carnegiea gigantea TaxID=171969 RepID=A0A9Q1GLU7_9CARY|nr:LOW QUALITY PROTEIN: hypothetical protein Cgig2_007646 [Carnegiea gigantea]
MNHIDLVILLMLLELHKYTHQLDQHHQTVNPTHLLLKGTTQQELHQKPASQESRESPSNGNNEDLVRSSQSKSVDKGKGLDGGKKNKSTTSKITRSARSSWKDNIQFDVKEEVLTIDDLGKEEVINGSILPRDVMNYKTGSKFIYLVDKGFDKHVFKHGVKHFKPYKHGLKKDYFKTEEKTKEDMYDIVPKGHSRGGWMQLTLAEIGRDARASQTHCHTTGSTGYAKKRANFVETHGKELTHLEFFKETHSKEERLLSSSPSKTQVEIENEVFDELIYEEENPKQPIDFSVNVDRSDIFGVNSILRKRGYDFPDIIQMCQRGTSIIEGHAVRNEKITDEFLDATEVALHMAGDQVQEESSGNNLSNELRHTGPLTLTSQVN